MVSHTSHDRAFKNPLNKYRNGAAYDLKMVSNLNKYSLRDPFTGIASSALTARIKSKLKARIRKCLRGVATKNSGVNSQDWLRGYGV